MISSELLSLAGATDCGHLGILREHRSQTGRHVLGELHPQPVQAITPRDNRLNPRRQHPCRRRRPVRQGIPHQTGQHHSDVAHAAPPMRNSSPVDSRSSTARAAATLRAAERRAASKHGPHRAANSAAGNRHAA